MKSPARSRSRVAKSRVVRRSFALPADLVAQVSEAAPPEYQGNLNATVRNALEEYVRSRRRRAFEKEMEQMAADPQVRAVNRELFEAFEATDAEGLPPA